ncbi:transmembrane protein, putative [Medicago truncatula]|uniref:Transmembrane protein, putative n=1 Tax=Medicago truncatula TaxID=3880 RepID=G7L5J6_MEDTR|nr:transmembrane protein, putative [Medicago truncatula]
MTHSSSPKEGVKVDLGDEDLFRVNFTGGMKMSVVESYNRSVSMKLGNLISWWCSLVALHLLIILSLLPMQNRLITLLYYNNATSQHCGEAFDKASSFLYYFVTESITTDNSFGYHDEVVAKFPTDPGSLAIVALGTPQTPQQVVLEPWLGSVGEPSVDQITTPKILETPNIDLMMFSDLDHKIKILEVETYHINCVQEIPQGNLYEDPQETPWKYLRHYLWNH